MNLVKLLESSSENLFVTGKAGTGKSTALRQFVERSDESAVVCAPTGVAAINARGQTIHSLFRIPPRMLNDDDIKEISFKQSGVVKHMKTLVIDEMPMVRADMIANLDLILRKCRGKPYEPFGGCRVIAFGDPYQLPPIVSGSEKEHFDREYESPYFFSSRAMKASPFRVIDLTAVFRQTDQEFIRILNDVRSGEISDADLALLNRRVGPQQKRSIVVCPYNAQVQATNEKMLNELPGKATQYHAEITDDFPKGAYPNDVTVSLKRGAQVMLLRNNGADGKFTYVNGTIATVVSLEKDYVGVEIPGKGTHQIEFSQWDSIKYDMNGKTLIHRVSGTFSQIPMKLAAAFSIHKIQGQTLDRIHVDFGRGTFDFGQAYVGLSRCRSLEGMTLGKAIRREDIRVDPRISKYFQEARRMGLVTEFHQDFNERLA